MAGIGSNDPLEQRIIQSKYARLSDNGSKILGHAGSAKSETRMQVSFANIQPVVFTQNRHHFPSVDTEAFRDPSEFVGKGDLGGMKRVAGILDQFSRFQ